MPSDPPTPAQRAEALVTIKHDARTGEAALFVAGVCAGDGPALAIDVVAREVRDAVARAITEAIEAECAACRAACEQVAAGHRRGRDHAFDAGRADRVSRYGHYADGADDCADAIRARGRP